jgi:metal-responsive CopG/Arc/MetJ family transcriptional regulator
VGATAGYTMGMKIAISIPDDVFNEAERLAAELHCSRSQLYTRAVRDYVARRSGDKVTEMLNAVYGEDQQQDLEFLRAAAEHIFEESEW